MSTDGVNEAGRAAELVQKIREEGIPKHRSYSLRAQDSGIMSTLMRDACEDAGINLDDPGKADQYYFVDAEMLVIDLGNATPKRDD
jgi:hypothetical protein